MMRPRFALLLVGCLITLVLSLARAAIADDAKDLQGTWRVVSLEANGENKPADEIKGWKFVFEGDQGWLIKPEETDQKKFKFRLDAAKTPKTIDLIVQEGDDKGKVAPGIYGFDNGQLRLCINIFGDPSYRPSDFKTQDKDGAGFAVLERVKE